MMTKPNDESTLVLPAELTIKDAAELQSLLQSGIDGDEAATVDAGGVETIDTAALQLLAAFSNAHVARGIAVRWLSVSDEIRTQAARLALADVLDFDASHEDTSEDDLCPVF